MKHLLFIHLHQPNGIDKIAFGMLAIIASALAVVVLFECWDNWQASRNR
jgi:hypothetical protein